MQALWFVPVQSSRCAIGYPPTWNLKRVPEPTVKEVRVRGRGRGLRGFRSFGVGAEQLETKA